MAKVTVRNKSMVDKKRSSLFLDYYPPIVSPITNKLIRKEYLRLFVFDKPKNDLEKGHNKETYQLAETIKAKRQIDIQREDHGFLSNIKSSINFIDFYREVGRKTKGGFDGNWSGALNYRHC